MTQVSRLKLNRKFQENILRNLFISISKVNKEDLSKLFLEDLLTRTEKIVLAKRLSIALLLESGKSYSEIREIVKVSASTISSVNNKLNTGHGYRAVIKKLHALETKQENSSLLDFLNSKTSLSSRNRFLSHSNKSNH